MQQHISVLLSELDSWNISLLVCMSLVVLYRDDVIVITTILHCVERQVFCLWKPVVISHNSACLFV